MAEAGVEHKFIKSKLNHGVESRAHDFVLQDRRFQKPSSDVKKQILRMLGLENGTWGPQSFDLIMTLQPAPPIDSSNLHRWIDDIMLVEVKATRDDHVKDIRMNRFFYGSTKNQYDLAEAAPDRLWFAFVVLTDDNAYGKPFFSLLPFSEVERRTRTKRIQYQVNFKTDVADADNIVGPLPDPDFME